MQVSLPPGGNDALALLTVVGDPDKYAAKIKELTELQAAVQAEVETAGTTAQRARADREAAEADLSKAKAIEASNAQAIAQHDEDVKASTASLAAREEAVAKREAAVNAAEKSVSAREAAVTAAEKKVAVDGDAAERALAAAMNAKNDAEARVARILEAAK